MFFFFGSLGVVDIPLVFSWYIYQEKTSNARESAAFKCYMARDISPYNLKHLKLYSLF